MFSLIAGSLLLTGRWTCSCYWSKSARCLILLVDFVKSLRALYQLMSVGVGTKEVTLFSSSFCSLESIVLDKLMAFSRRILFYLFDALFFLNLYLLRISFILSTITSFLNFWLFLPTDVIGSMLPELIFPT